SGLVVNGVTGGFVMWPPIFREPWRDPARAELNKLALDEICEAIAPAGAGVGMHPEGTRGQGPDPYTLLPAQPRLGQVVMRARPIVLPAWIRGISNDFPREIRSAFTGGDKIFCVFGAPLDFGDLLDATPRAAQYKRVADFILGEIAKLGAIERAMR